MSNDKEPSVDDLFQRLNALKTPANGNSSKDSGPAPSISDLERRLAKLKNPDSSAVISQPKKHFPIQKRLTEQEEIDLLLDQVSDDVRLSAEDEFDFFAGQQQLEQRLQHLKGFHSVTGGNSPSIYHIHRCRVFILFREEIVARRT